MAKKKNKKSNVSNTVTLTHPNPMIDDRDFPAEQAKKIMSLENNGGWKYKDEPETKKENGIQDVSGNTGDSEDAKE